MLLPWMEAVTRAAGGRLVFEAYPAMQLGGTAAQLYDQARAGVVDIVWTQPGYNAGRFPRLEVFELPFLMTEAESASRACWDYLQAHAAEEFQDTQVLAAHTHGPGVLHTRERAIRSIADVRGLRLYSPSRQVTRLLQRLGAEPVALPPAIIPAALARGTLDGCLLPWEEVPSVKVEGLTRFHSEFEPGTGALYTTTFVLAMNKARYLGLAPELRAAIDAHSGGALSGGFGKLLQAGEPAGRQAALQRGNRVHRFTRAQALGFRQRARALEADWTADLQRKGYDGARLLAAARALMAGHTAAGAGRPAGMAGLAAASPIFTRPPGAPSPSARP